MVEARDFARWSMVAVVLFLTLVISTPADAQLAGIDGSVDFLEGRPAGERKLLVGHRAAQNGQKSFIHIPPVP